MRGSQSAYKSISQLQGIIPAHAGLTVTRMLGAASARDHPRACGAHGTYADMGKLMEGSSPRMRGSPRGSDARKAQPGIIPAHAGLTLPAAAHRDGSGDHPRACGAHQWKRSSGHRRKGSSPRMRGSPAHAAHGNNHRGIIPAHAGLTSFIFVSPFVIWDHPRACGAHLPQVLPIQVSWGSSPRMRGSQSAKALSCMTRGIIPAHAGLTSAVCRSCPRRGDHPRACGAHVFNSPADIGGWGSSPRMRGSPPC